MEIQMNAYNMNYSWAVEEASIKNPMTLTFSPSLLCALGVEHGRINWKLVSGFHTFWTQVLYTLLQIIENLKELLFIWVLLVSVYCIRN